MRLISRGQLFRDAFSICFVVYRALQELYREFLAPGF